MPLVHIETFGCQMNVADSELLLDALARRGYAKTEDRRVADLLVVNTCSVRENAESRAKTRLRELAAAKRASRGRLALWVIGCMAERIGEKLRDEIPGIDAVIGAQRLEFIEQFVDGYLGISGDLSERIASATTRPVASFVPVMRGCDNFCTYCIVPHVRGREHSVPSGDVEDQVRKLVGNGVREVTLLGQNVNSYRSEGVDFPDLMTRVHKVPGLARLRFTTSHPKDCSEKLIRTVAELPKICKHIHLPVQSGSTTILSAMNRGYSRDDYLRVIDMIRRYLPSVDITTDVMTGFPGETEKDYAHTISLLEKVRFTAAFMFAYSPRPGTAAHELADDVPHTVKTVRLNHIIDVQTAITKGHYAAMVGKRIEILLAEPSRGHAHQWIGQDVGSKRAALPCPTGSSGMILEATVVKSTGMTLVCEA